MSQHPTAAVPASARIRRVRSVIGLALASFGLLASACGLGSGIDLPTAGMGNHDPTTSTSGSTTGDFFGSGGSSSAFGSGGNSSGGAASGGSSMGGLGGAEPSCSGLSSGSSDADQGSYIQGSGGATGETQNEAHCQVPEN